MTTEVKPYEPLHVVWELARERLGHLGPVVVAGGAVRDYLLDRYPKDYDVFVLGLTPDSYVSSKAEARRVGFASTARDVVRAGLLTLPEAVEVPPEPWYGERHPYQVVTVRAELPDRTAVTVQGVCSPQLSVEGLLHDFDWNVCRFAYDGERLYGDRYPGRWIAPGEPLLLNGADPAYPLSTLRRGFRFSERFGMVLGDDVLAYLLREAAQEVGIRRLAQQLEDRA